MNAPPDGSLPPDWTGRPTRSDLFAWSVPGAWLRYRIMAFVVGTALLCLTVVVICQYPLHMSAQMKTPEKIVAPIHGYLYLLYLVMAADLARRARWSLGRIVLVVCSGFVPFLAFIVEHRVNRQMEAEWAVAPADTVARGDVPTGPLA